MKYICCTFLLLLVLTSASSQQQSIPGNSEYTFTAPEGWKASMLNGMNEYNSDLLECSDYSYYTLYCMHPQVIKGTLLDFAKQIHQSLYGGKGDDYIKYEPADECIIKGTTSQGLEYISYCTDAQKIINNNTPDHDIFWEYYMVYAIRNADKAYPFLLMEKPYNYKVGGRSSTVNGFFGDCKPLEKIWHRFEASITISKPSVSGAIDINDITGSWVSRLHTGWSGMAGGEYAVENTKITDQFNINGNGTFIRSEALKNKTEGAFSINGNKITFKESSGKSYTYTIHILSIFQFGHWKRHLILSDNSGNDLELNEE